MLMIKFYGNFCSFHRLYILKIEIQLKNEEINWNSELQNSKAEPEVENKELEKALANFSRVAKIFSPCKIRKASNFRSLCEISQGCELACHSF